MKHTITLVVGLWIMAFPRIYSQNIDSCEVDIQALQKPVTVQDAPIKEGTLLYLSDEYLEDLEGGKYRGVPAGIIHYVYVRPASKKEIKSKEVEGNQREIIGIDGNIYVAKVPFAQQHFFETNLAFEGKFDPYWEDPDLVIPIGLSPVNIQHFADQAFIVSEKTDSYMLLSVDDREFVFFIGYPAIGDVFDSEAMRQRIAEKQEAANELVDRDWVVFESYAPLFRSDLGVTAPYDLFQQTGKKAFHITSAKALKWGTEMSAEAFPDNVVPDTIFTIYDKGCLARQKDHYLRQVSENVESENLRISHILHTSNSDQEWIENEWLRTTLLKRFWKRPDSTSGTEYHHVLLPKKEAEYIHLQGRVLDNGRSWIKSHFYSEEGLIHTRITLYQRGRRDSLESERISTQDPRNIRIYTRDWIIEEINFDHPDDQDIIERIARNTDRTFTVRFKAGGSYYRDVKLPLAYKEQIRDAWMLGKIIAFERKQARINANEVDYD